MKKKMVTVLLTAAMVTAMAAGCGKSSASGSDKKESYTIGIEQFAEHGSLDNCREGFLKGLEDEGIKEGDNLTVKYKNAAADMGTAKQISDTCFCECFRSSQAVFKRYSVTNCENVIPLHRLK